MRQCRAGRISLCNPTIANRDWYYLKEPDIKLDQWISVIFDGLEPFKLDIMNHYGSVQHFKEYMTEHNFYFS